MPARILLGEPDTLLSDLLGAHLKRMFPEVQIATARSLHNLERLCADVYDLAVVDLHLDDGDIFEWLKQQRVSGRVLVLTSCMKEAPIHRLLQLGTAAVVHKAEGLAFLEDAVRIALAGGSVISPKIREINSRMRADPHSFVRILSDREQEILAHFGAGHTSQEIAAVLKISEATVSDHRKNLMSKLGLKGQAQLLGYALGKGFFPGIPLHPSHHNHE